MFLLGRLAPASGMKEVVAVGVGAAVVGTGWGGGVEAGSATGASNAPIDAARGASIGS